MAEINKAIKVNNIYTNIIDNITGKPVNYIETLTWHDGSLMDDTKVDGIIYRKKDDLYYKLCFDDIVNVKWFGAKGTGLIDDTSSIISAISYMNNMYNNQSGLLQSIKKRGKLIIPDGVYSISEPLVVTGNYDIEMIGSLSWVGSDNLTMMKIGIDNVNISNCDYNLSGVNSTSNTNVIGFELCNIATAKIFTRKIDYFKEGIRVVAKSTKGCFFNTFVLGSFTHNDIDIHICNETNGWPNANRFYGGEFYKKTNSAYEINSIKMSSLDGTGKIDSNIFNDCHFEEGKPNHIPINLHNLSENNRFNNIRIEQTNDTYLARDNGLNNSIYIRASYGASSRIFSTINNQTGASYTYSNIFNVPNVLQDVKENAGGTLFYHPDFTFSDAWYPNVNVLSKYADAITSTFEKTTTGLRMIDSRGQIRIRIKTNGTRYFKTYVYMGETNTKCNIGIAPYDDTIARIPLVDATLATEADWGYNRRIKTNEALPMLLNYNIPYTEAGNTTKGAYTTPTPRNNISLAFELHSSVKYFDIILFWAFATPNDDNKFTLIGWDVRSTSGRPTTVPILNRTNYEYIGNKLYVKSLGTNNEVIYTAQ